MTSQWKWPLAALLGVLLGGVAIADDDEHEHEGRRRMAPVSNAKYQAECASCHTLYHPALLPERSWRKLMAGLDKHFGQDASVDAPTNKEITDFLVKHSSNRMAGSSTPLRITETARFRREHDEISPSVWKRPKVGSPANCSACHSGAEQGDFSEHRVRIPR